MGFPTPYKAWLGGALFEEMQMRILDSSFCHEGYVNRQIIEKRLTEFGQGVSQNTSFIWKLLCLSMWNEAKENLSDVSYAVPSGR